MLADIDVLCCIDYLKKKVKTDRQIDEASDSCVDGWTERQLI